MPRSYTINNINYILKDPITIKPSKKPPPKL